MKRRIQEFAVIFSMIAVLSLCRLSLKSTSTVPQYDPNGPKLDVEITEHHPGFRETALRQGTRLLFQTEMHRHFWVRGDSREYITNIFGPPESKLKAEEVYVWRARINPYFGQGIEHSFFVVQFDSSERANSLWTYEKLWQADWVKLKRPSSTALERGEDSVSRSK